MHDVGSTYQRVRESDEEYSEGPLTSESEYGPASDFEDSSDEETYGTFSDSSEEDDGFRRGFLIRSNLFPQAIETHRIGEDRELTFIDSGYDDVGKEAFYQIYY